MKILLDTCIVYDWLMGTITDRPTISDHCRRRPRQPGFRVGNGGQARPRQDAPAVPANCHIEAQGFRWLNINPYHAQTVLHLAGYHKDPFDRMLIAQARHESLSIVTYDAIFKRYLADTLIVRH